MTYRIAHVTDLHLNGTEKRRQKFLDALQKARTLGAQHLVITGDLTSHGRIENFSELGNILAGTDPNSVTIVPGNHDIGLHNGKQSKWCHVLQTTNLGRFRRTSVPGSIVEHGDCAIVAVDTTMQSQALGFSALGHFPDEQLKNLDTFAGSYGKCIVVAMHHGNWSEGPMFLFEGLTNWKDVEAVVAKHPNLHVLCGHHHRLFNKKGVFGAPAVVDHDDPLRMYEVRGTCLVPTYQGKNETGKSLSGWF